MGVNIVTPHAALIVWNYRERLGTTPTDRNYNEVDEVVISTLSCVSIETSKSKSNPQGSFQVTLAPNRNWVSTLTPGSWCVILMSNTPITPDDLKSADPEKVRMFGKIDSVRVDTTMGEDGARRTQYLVSGIDWGHIFNNTIYIDTHIGAEDEPQTLGQGFAISIGNILFGDKGTPKSFAVKDNLRSIIGIFGQPVKPLTSQGTDINRLPNALYNFNIPQQMAQYFNFLDPNGNPSHSKKLNDLITLITGSLTDEDMYNNESEANGFIDPFSLQGTHSFWQVLLENSNPALNEMVSDLKWSDNGLQLALYNRIKPFSFKGFGVNAGESNDLRSYFQYLKTTTLPDDYIVSVNAGTNWADKYNFIEIKPTFTDFQVFQNWYKQKAQKSDPLAFEREGFRPLIAETKQFPVKDNNVSDVDFDDLASWSSLMEEWYFDTHRMLNGRLVMVGINDYIGVGENIKFSSKLIDPTGNLNSTTIDNTGQTFVLAHVESINHSFSLGNGGARQWVTTINFVRGLIVDKMNVSIDEATIDSNAGVIDTKNTANVISTSESQDPDPNKLKGT